MSKLLPVPTRYGPLFQTSIEALRKTFPGLSEEQIALIYTIIIGRMNLMSFDDVGSWTTECHEGMTNYREGCLIAINEVMGADGVETITTEGSVLSLARLLYVNRGNTYDTTFLLDLEKHEVSLGSWGDWVEAKEGEGHHRDLSYRGEAEIEVSEPIHKKPDRQRTTVRITLPPPEPSLADDDEEEEEEDSHRCSDCNARVGSDDQFVATPCGTYCSECMNSRHGPQCSICASEFDLGPYCSVCREQYSANGDGYDGLCPACSDRAERPLVQRCNACGSYHVIPRHADIPARSQIPLPIHFGRKYPHFEGSGHQMQIIEARSIPGFCEEGEGLATVVRCLYCDECQAPIPEDYADTIHGWHTTACSLHPNNVGPS